MFTAALAIDRDLPSEGSLQALAGMFTAHRRWLVLTGAGCSTASGIPDYRDLDGQWKRPQPVTLQAFMGSAATRQRYWARSLLGWRLMAHAEPGATHLALAQLERLGHVHCLVTQNVDGLHSAAGSRKVIDLHGRIDGVRCMDCGAPMPRVLLQRQLLARNPGWADLDAAAAPDGDADLDGRDFSAFDVPACSQCGGILKPDVVFYGEGVPRPRVEAVRAALGEADGLLVVGSSLMVYSGLRFVHEAAAQAKPIVAINQGRMRAEDMLRLKVEQDCGASREYLLRHLSAAAPAVRA
jgi:NAD-dependent SIR2 family protein deacetylase